jgi:hypothetical protein
MRMVAGAMGIMSCHVDLPAIETPISDSLPHLSSQEVRRYPIYHCMMMMALLNKKMAHHSISGISIIN